jgi:hypothetical protein
MYDFFLSFGDMARVNLNSLLNGLSGRLGNAVLKNYASGTIVSSRPDRSKVILSDVQKESNSKFKHAVAFAKGVLADPEKRKMYEANLKPGQSVYHAALAEFMKK